MRQDRMILAILVALTSGCVGDGTSSSSMSNSSSVVSSSNSSSSQASGSLSNAEWDSACNDLLTNSATNWRDSALPSDQDIVKCLAESLGKPIGYGENTTGGFDPAGSSNLVVITNKSSVLPEQQLLDAISSPDYNWIVFDKNDFASENVDIAMYRLECDESSVLAALDNATTNECLNHKMWCANHGGLSGTACLETFFNDKLNDSSLPIRNVMIDSNTTIDGRGSKSGILFNGFKIGADSSGASTHISNNVILTNLYFHGAGHAEDHQLDPDMIRSTGESHDIWIHHNTFSNTGDSAFDVKVGAYDITVSFNRLQDVLRSSLHGSSDSRTINEQIRTTIHNNLFLTSDSFYDGPHAANNTARRVPLIRRGTAHLFNNVFMNYRKNFASVRVGATLRLDHNMFLGGQSIKNEKSGQAGFDEWITNLTKNGLDGGNFTSNDTMVRYASESCVIESTYSGTSIPNTIGGAAPDQVQNYSSRSKNTLNREMMNTGQDLVDYALATAGKGGAIPYSSPKTPGRSSILNMPRGKCL